MIDRASPDPAPPRCGDACEGRPCLREGCATRRRNAMVALEVAEADKRRLARSARAAAVQCCAGNALVASPSGRTYHCSRCGRYVPI